MPKTALFPGSFDPFTLGHEDIVRRALPLFDELYIGIGENQDKRYQLPWTSAFAWWKGSTPTNPASTWFPTAG